MNREAERKRLVELTRKHIREELGMNLHTDILEKFADHLLDNGIVVPPVKVGDEINGETVIRVEYAAGIGRDKEIHEKKMIHTCEKYYIGKSLLPTHPITWEDAVKALEGSGEK